MGKDWRKLDPEMLASAGIMQTPLGDPMVTDGGLNAMGPTGMIMGFIGMTFAMDDDQMVAKIQLRGAGGYPVLVEWSRPIPVFANREVTLPFGMGVTVQLEEGD